MMQSENRKQHHKIIGYMAKSIKTSDSRSISDKAHKVLLGSTDIINALINSSSNGIYMVQDGRFIYVSTQFMKLTDYKYEDVLGKQPLTLVHKDDREIVRKNAIACLKGERMTPYEYRFLRKDGKVIWILEKVASAEIKGRKVAVGSFMDITEYKKLEKASADYKALNTVVIDDSPYPILLVNKDTSIRYVNRAFSELTGFDSNEVLGVKVPYPHWIEGDTEAMVYGLNKAFQTGLWREEVAFKNKKGDKIWVELTAATVDSGDTLFATYVDITERKLAEDKLKESELKYRVLTDSSLTGIYIQQDGKYVYVNEQFARMHGYRADELIGKDYMMLVHPEDKEEFKDNIDKVFHGEYLSHRGETRRLKRDGGIIWCQMITTTIEYRDKPAIMGNVINITERKNMETELRLKARMLDEATDSIIVHDEQGNIVYVNEVATRLYGYDASELLQMKIGQIIVPAQRWIFLSQLPDLFARGNFTFQTNTVNKDGIEIITEIHSRVIDSDGKKLVISITHDITVRHKAEEELLILATHDILTGLPNRNLLSDRINMAVANAERNKAEMAVMMIDLDRFKNINDEFGHEVGDRLLKETADRLVRTLRKSDTISRMGGDEFFIILPEIKAASDAGKIAEKVIQVLRTPFELGEHKLDITASIGVAVYPHDGINPDTLTRNADKAMYRAKEGGRNKYEVFTRPGSQN